MPLDFSVRMLGDLMNVGLKDSFTCEECSSFDHVALEAVVTPREGARAWIVGGAVTNYGPVDNSKAVLSGSDESKSEKEFNVRGTEHSFSFRSTGRKNVQGPPEQVPTSVDRSTTISGQGSSSDLFNKSFLTSSTLGANDPGSNFNVLLRSNAGEHNGERSCARENSAGLFGRSAQRSTSRVIEFPVGNRVHALDEGRNIGASAGGANQGPGELSAVESTSGNGSKANSGVCEEVFEQPECSVSETNSDAPVLQSSDVPRPLGLQHSSHEEGECMNQVSEHLTKQSPGASSCPPRSFSSITAIEKRGDTGLHQLKPGREVDIPTNSVELSIPLVQEKQNTNVKPAICRVQSNIRCPGYQAKTGGNPKSRCRKSFPEDVPKDVVDQIHRILEQFGWTRETVSALNQISLRLLPFHINEVLKHQKDPSLACNLFNWAETQSGYKHDVCTYTTMIGILGRVRNFNGCNLLLERMRKDGCEPTVVTFNRLIHLHGRANDLNQALKIFYHMQEVGCQPDRVTYCTLIDLHSKSGFHGTAMDLCDKMWKAGFQPDTFSCSLIIHCLGKAGNLPAASKMFHEMIARGCKPNLVTYNIMIDLNAKSGNYDTALKLYNDMQDEGYRPDKVTYNVVMEVLGNCGNPEEAEEVFYEMVQEGWAGDAHTFGLLVNMWGLYGNVQKASEWYMKMLESGLTPNGPTVASLLGAYLRAHQYDGAMDVMQSLARWGLRPTLSTYTLLLGSCTACSRKEDVDSVFHLMMTSGHPAHNFLCRLLNLNNDEAGDYVQQFFSSVRFEDQEIKRGFADALMEFLCKWERTTLAGYVWEIALEHNLYPSAISQRVPNSWIVDLHVMSKGTALVALSKTLASFRERMLSTGVVPSRIEIVTGWGRHSRVAGLSLVKNAVQNLLRALESPFYIDNANIGCFVGSGQPLADWLHQPDMDQRLAL